MMDTKLFSALQLTNHDQITVDSDKLESKQMFTFMLPLSL